MGEAKRIEKCTIEDYYALPEGTRAELIDGVIYNMSPAPLRIHQAVIAEMIISIGSFIKSHQGQCKVYPSPFDVRLNNDNVVQPDISVICDPDKLTDKGCDGAPDWIIEITSSNYAHDYFTKANLYFISGVREYWIVDPKKEKITVYLYHGDDFDSTVYQLTDTIPVHIYNGELQINIAELLK